MRLKFKKADVLKFRDSIFYIEDIKHELYQVVIVDEIRIGNSVWKRGSKIDLNKNFIELHCKLVKDATAKAIKVLYGNRD